MYLCLTSAASAAASSSSADRTSLLSDFVATESFLERIAAGPVGVELSPFRMARGPVGTDRASPFGVSDPVDGVSKSIPSPTPLDAPFVLLVRRWASTSFERFSRASRSRSAFETNLGYGSNPLVSDRFL